MGSTWGTMLAVGAAIGGAVTMRFGRDVAFVVDAASFLASAVILAVMRTPFSERLTVDPFGSAQGKRWPLAEGMSDLPTANSQRPTLLDSIRETLRYARAHPRVLALLTSKGG